LHMTEYALNGANLSLKEGLDFHPHSRVSRWVPGTRMSYCNSGPPVAAYIVEKITGQKFEDYIEEQFFQPMGMETMTYFASEQYKQLGAALYIDKDPQQYWNIGVRPSGAINASPKDMARMLRFFINRGRIGSLQLISEPSLKRMETPSSSTGARAGLESGYGLSNYSTPHKSFVYRSHTGGVAGGLTDFSYLPTHQVGYVVMINSGDGNALYRIRELIRNYQTKDLASDKVSSSRVGPIPDKGITGYYVPINPRVQMAYNIERILHIRSIWENDKFIFSNNLLGGRIATYVSIGNKQYVSAETGKISLVQVNDPLVGEAIHEDTQVLMRVSPLLAFGQLILGALWIIYGIGCSNNISVGLWPYCTSILFLALCLLQVVGMKNPLELLGQVGFVSVALMVLSICFALAALGSGINLIKKRKAKIDRRIYWHLAILSALHLMVTGYFLWHGVIGIRTWT
jgi:hypothetical protein